MCRLCSKFKCVALILLMRSNFVDGTCASYWSIESDSNGKYGIFSIPNPDRSQNILKIQLTLAAQVSSVS